MDHNYYIYKASKTRSLYIYAKSVEIVNITSYENNAKHRVEGAYISADCTYKEGYTYSHSGRFYLNMDKAEKITKEEYELVEALYGE